LYQEKHGAAEGKIIEAAENRGIVPPDFILNAPTLDAGEVFFIDCFSELDTCRTYAGMDAKALPIPWNVMKDYCAALALCGNEEMRFISIIRQIDNWFITRKTSNGPEPTK